MRCAALSEPAFPFRVWGFGGVLGVWGWRGLGFRGLGFRVQGFGSVCVCARVSLRVGRGGATTLLSCCCCCCCCCCYTYRSKSYSCSYSYPTLSHLLFPTPFARIAPPTATTPPKAAAITDAATAPPPPPPPPPPPLPPPVATTPTTATFTCFCDACCNWERLSASLIKSIRAAVKV